MHTDQKCLNHVISDYIHKKNIFIDIYEPPIYEYQNIIQELIEPSNMGCRHMRF